MMIVFCSYLAIFAKYPNLQVEVNAFIALIFLILKLITVQQQQKIRETYFMISKISEVALVRMLEDDCEPTQG